MVALHGSGRSTEALAAARRLRHLVTDVGLDPGDRIRVLEALREDPDTLILVLDQHALLASLPSEKIEDGEVETVAGSVEATVDDNGTIHFDDATVLEADIEATNGIIHAVDTVLIPDPVNLKDLSD